MTRSSGSYKQLIEYMLKGQRETAGKGQSFILKRNLTSASIEGMVQEFQMNEANRRFKRKDATKIFHEVYSIKNISKGKVTAEMLKDIASKFLELRNPNALCIAVPHFTSNPHIHFMMSGVEVETGLSLRISKQDFAVFKRELDSYAQTKYPQLLESKVEHGKKKDIQTKAKSDKEFQMIKRTNALLEKDRIKETLDSCYLRSLSRADFYHRLSMEGLATYSRNGTVKGVEGDRRYGMGGLGFDEKSLRELDIKSEAIKGMQIYRDEIEQRQESRDIYSQDIEADTNGTNSWEKSVGFDHTKDNQDQCGDPEEIVDNIDENEESL